MAPPSARQLASPCRTKLSRPVSPSISVSHPCVGSRCTQPAAVSAVTSSPTTITDQCFMVISPLLVDDYDEKRGGMSPSRSPKSILRQVERELLERVAV